MGNAKFVGQGICPFCPAWDIYRSSRRGCWNHLVKDWTVSSPNRDENRADERYFLSTSRDMTARMYTLDPLEGFKPKSFGGHRDAVLGAWFSADEKTVCLGRKCS